MQANSAKPKNIIPAMREDGRFTTLIAALKVVLPRGPPSDVAVLSVFAPTDEAFAKIPEETLNGLLEDVDALSPIIFRHIIFNSTVLAEDIIAAGKVEAKNALSYDNEVDDAAEIMLDVSYDAETGVTVTSSAGSAMVVTPDIIVNRGVVHTIDTVI